MFPLSALLSHAELTRRKSSGTEKLEARRAPRRTRCGNLTLFPRIENVEPLVSINLPDDEPCVIASISNVSTTGLGLILEENLPSGLEFDVDWHEGEFPVALRYEVIHSQPMSAGLYRTGARLIVGVMPEPQMPTDFVGMEQPSEYDIVDDNSEPSPVVFSGGILKFEPNAPEQSDEPKAPAPPGTFRASSACGFDKTETMDGVTTCGWERSISIRRTENRLWIYIHSPGKKNGWGIFVDPDQFESAFNRIQQGASSPFISTMAA